MMKAWETIPGWFDFADIYDQAVVEAEDGAQFLEIGCWLGRSTCYLGQRILESGKAITVHVIDTFEGVPNDPVQAAFTNQGVSVIEVFRSNLINAGIDHLVRVYPESSASALRWIPDRSIEMAFIDGDHSYEAVARDIKNCLPKIKAGGVLAGHDFFADGVQKAVNELLGPCPASRSSWAMRIS